MCIKEKTKRLLEDVLAEGNLSKAELARKMGISAARLSNWVRGQSGIPNGLLKSLCKASKLDKARFWKLVESHLG